MHLTSNVFENTISYSCGISKRVKTLGLEGLECFLHVYQWICHWSSFIGKTYLIQVIMLGYGKTSPRGMKSNSPAKYLLVTIDWDCRVNLFWSACRLINSSFLRRKFLQKLPGVSQLSLYQLPIVFILNAYNNTRIFSILLLWNACAFS